MEIDPETTQDAKVYEIGFHIVPTVAEDAVPAEFEAIKDLVKKEGGEIISEGSPVLMNLAYDISKTVKAVKTKHSKAYFAWVKFTLTPDAIAKIKTALDASATILRYLIILTVKESTLWSDKDLKRNLKGEAKDGEVVAESEEELDKTIDGLVVN